MNCATGGDIKPARLERGNRQLAPEVPWRVKVAALHEKDLALLRVLMVALAVVVIGGGVFLATWDIPAPSRQIEIVVPDERLPR